MPHASDLPSFYDPNNIWGEVQIMEITTQTLELGPILDDSTSLCLLTRDGES